jgi:hypothetical protein
MEGLNCGTKSPKLGTRRRKDNEELTYLARYAYFPRIPSYTSNLMQLLDSAFHDLRLVPSPSRLDRDVE